MLTENQIKVLRMVGSNMVPNARTLSAYAAMEKFNLHIPTLLKAGLIEHAPRKACAYKLTKAGENVLSAK